MPSACAAARASANALWDRNEIGPWIWYRSMTSIPKRSRELRAADRSAARTLTFHGLGMNFDAMTTRLRTPGSAASRRPMMRSLSPPP